jgi:hypothetical protein
MVRIHMARRRFSTVSRFVAIIHWQNPVVAQGAHHVAAQGDRVPRRERRMVGFEEDLDDGVHGPARLHEADIDLARLDAGQRLTNDRGDRRHELVRRSPIQERYERLTVHAHRHADRD